MHLLLKIIGLLAVPFLLISAFSPLYVHALRWHAGCMCAFKEDSTDSDANGMLNLAALFGTRFFRIGGKISEFCPCSIDSVQALNQVYIAPKLERLLNTTFFRYYRVDLDATCPFWDAEGYCTIRDCSVEVCIHAMYVLHLSYITHALYVLCYICIRVYTYSMYCIVFVCCTSCLKCFATVQ